jgi:hypothetical protein
MFLFVATTIEVTNSGNDNQLIKTCVHTIIYKPKYIKHFICKSNSVTYQTSTNINSGSNLYIPKALFTNPPLLSLDCIVW